LVKEKGRKEAKTKNGVAARGVVVDWRVIERTKKKGRKPSQILFLILWEGRKKERKEARKEGKRRWHN
jgi:hypothetical protein